MPSSRLSNYPNFLSLTKGVNLNFTSLENTLSLTGFIGLILGRKIVRLQKKVIARVSVCLEFILVMGLFYHASAFLNYN
ncbi:CLUMA_CG001733, isoform A [Clunio marinus]|uniref:CLUMA_CG001733, isoform A n=1 Tax=Clunio marinus TaxID=568069 RepID=A0A1J1HJ56_9DIPT|nr:CLUMA_CG001733, isoform A [Clunio marinus]